MLLLLQSLSLTIIYSLAQGALLYGSLWLALKLAPDASAKAKYNLSLAALTLLFGWFIVTWYQQYNDAGLQAAGFADARQGALSVFQYQQLPLQAGNNGLLNHLPEPIRGILPFIPLLYLAGLSLMLFRLSAGISQVYSLRKKGLSQPVFWLGNMLGEVKKKLNFSGTVRLMVSVKIRVPVVIGFIKPLILIPAAALTELSPAQFETILLHELAHIRRNDYLVNILQTVVETLLFFNPFTWLLSALIRTEREYCCDDEVIAHTPEPIFYATAIAALAIAQTDRPALTMAATGSSHQLFYRIKRIMEMKNTTTSYSRMAAAIVISATIACSLVWLAPALAHPKKDQPSKAVAGKTKNVEADPAAADNKEQGELIQRLSKDGLVDESKGFTVERKQQLLFINGKQQTATVAARYLKNVKQTELNIEVLPFGERLMNHPGASLLQMVSPVMSASPCIKYKSGKKPGC